MVCGRTSPVIVSDNIAYDCADHRPVSSPGWLELNEFKHATLPR
jgi:hypothetical protein